MHDLDRLELRHRPLQPDARCIATRLTRRLGPRKRDNAGRRFSGPEEPGAQRLRTHSAIPNPTVSILDDPHRGRCEPPVIHARRIVGPRYRQPKDQSSGFSRAR